MIHGPYNIKIHKIRFTYYIPMYAHTFHVTSFLQVHPPKLCTHCLQPIRATSPTLFSSLVLIILIRFGASRHYAISPNIILLSLSLSLLCPAPCFHTHSRYMFFVCIILQLRIPVKLFTGGYRPNITFLKSHEPLTFRRRIFFFQISAYPVFKM